MPTLTHIYPFRPPSRQLLLFRRFSFVKVPSSNPLPLSQAFIFIIHPCFRAEVGHGSLQKNIH